MVELKTWDTSELLTAKDITLYPKTAFEDVDPEMLPMTLVEAAKAGGMTHNRAHDCNNVFGAACARGAFWFGFQISSGAPLRGSALH